jgi:predicted nucleic acid-binding protein
MIKHIVLDSSPLGAMSHPHPGTAAAAVAKWAASCSLAGHKIYIPEVIDYEIRRELLRADKKAGIAKLDKFKSTFQYIPITTVTVLLAADLWAESRQGGYSTGDPKKLDIDVILAAQALTLGIPANDLIIATTNVRHLSRFVPADEWQNISP